ncbi:CynX/NimT family MFS transporter [Streptomyces sp. NPDC056160]|uniref:CynX/NimT family MFS transporter n=1 Tax=Streptomyces sp. NPDC056160 TaxID=3345731 RepID=UPI0035E0FF06
MYEQSSHPDPDVAPDIASGTAPATSAPPAATATAPTPSTRHATTTTAPPAPTAMTATAPAAAPAAAAVGRGRRGGLVLLAAGLLLAAFNLRVAIASVGPVLDGIEHGQPLSSTAAGILTTIPVLCFGGFAFATPALVRRWGMHRLLGVTMLLLAAGVLVRLQPSTAALFSGTVVAGASIAVANVLMPGLIKHDFAHRSGLMMGLYTTSLFVGAAAASGLTIPLENALGTGWRHTLALWALPAIAAFLLWLPQTGGRRAAQAADHRLVLDGSAPASPKAPGARTAGLRGGPGLRALAHDRTAWAVTVFMGTQSLGYYAMLSWVPSLLQDAGMSDGQAGWMLSFSTFPGIVASLLTPALGRRPGGRAPAVIATVALCAVAYAGLATAPVSLVYLWMVLLGLGQGAAISLALSLIVWCAPDAAHASALSTLAQGTGYLVAALGPFGLGAVHSLAGGWTVPMAALGAVLAVQLVAGLLASREDTARDGDPALPRRAAA